MEVNGKMCSLPNPIPTNKPNVEPRRPPKPVDITPLCKLNPALANTVSIKWTVDHGKNWVLTINLVEKLTSSQLLSRLQDKGSRKKEFTREMIQKITMDDGDDIATTDIKVELFPYSICQSLSNKVRANYLIALNFRCPWPVPWGR